ncbi:MAG: hypothetical protein QXT13_05800 [Pyrobaculum sp.]
MFKTSLVACGVISLALAVVIAAVLLGVAPAFAGRSAEALPVEAAPYVKAEDAGATLHNLVVFFALLVAATVVIYLLFSKRRLLSLFLYFVWFILSVGVFQFYVILYYWYGFLDEGVAVKLMWTSLLFGLFVVFLVYKRRGDLLLGFLGGLAGAMFVWLLPDATVLALLAALPVYDYLMVSRGLLGKIVKKSKEAAPPSEAGGRRDTPLFGFVVRLKTISLGVGDFVVYSMALSFVAMKLARLGPAVLLLVGAGALLIYLGFQLTVDVFLKRWGYGPALPFPLLLLSPLIAAAWLATAG